MPSYHDARTPYKGSTAVERLSDHIRLRSLPWPARRLMRRHGLHAATARTVAELVGYTMEDR